MTESESSLDALEDDLERASELETEAAVELLESTHRRLRELEGDPDVDGERRATLEAQVSQRVRQVSRREEYDSGLGAAMNPDEEDAP